jgi:hypothetical protein
MDTDNPQVTVSSDRREAPALTPARVRTLLERVTPPVVTITLPLDPARQDGEHARLSLKNLLADARRQVDAWPEGDAESLLAPAQRLAEDDQWWRGRGRGFVVLLAPGGLFEHFAVLDSFAATSTVAAQIAVRALLPAIHSADKFFVLAISQNRAQLFTGDRYGLTPSTTPLSPGSLADAMRYFEHSNDLNRHGGGQPSGTGRPVEGVHGQGSQRDSRKSELHEYFRGVDQSVRAIVGDSDDAPLVLAIDAPEFPIYREVSSYPQLMDDIVAGNPDHLRADELHRRAFATLASRFDRERESSIARYRESIGTGRCSTFIADIVGAAEEGRIATVFVGSDRPVWGHIDAATGSVVINSKHKPGDEDLVNRTVAETLRHGGTAYGDVDLGVHEMAVLFRY